MRPIACADVVIGLRLESARRRDEAVGGLEVGSLGGPTDHEGLHEQVAETLVEDDLGRQARVGAAEEGGARTLPSRQFVTGVDVLTGMTRLTGHEARVAALHLLPGLRGRGGATEPAQR